MPVEPQAPYISSKEAAKKYGLTNDHIGLLCRRGKIQGLLWGRVWFVSEPSLTEYVKKSGEEKEERKRVLSKQWSRAWAALFFGFVFLTAGVQHAYADYISPSPRLHSAPEPMAMSIASVARSVNKIKEQIPAPTLAAPRITAPVNTFNAEKVNSQTNGDRFVALMISGVEQVKESLAQKPAGASIHIVYAQDVSIAPPSQDLTLVATVLKAAAAPPVPEFSYTLPTVQPFFTRANIFAGLLVVNEHLYAFNTAMFGVYKESVDSLAAVTAVDASAGGVVWDATFGAFGERFVADLNHLNDAQVGMYINTAAALKLAYNSFADSIKQTPTFDSSISVASIGSAPTVSLAGDCNK